MAAYSVVAAATLVLRASEPLAAGRCLAFSAACSAGLGLALRCGAGPRAAASFGAGLLAALAGLLPGPGSALAVRWLGAAAHAQRGIVVAAGQGYPSPAYAPGGFLCPWVPVVPWAALCANVGLMAQLPAAAWIRLAVVTAAVLVHHGYTRDHWASVVGDDAKVVDGGSDCAGGTARSGELTVDLLVDDKPGTIRIL